MFDIVFDARLKQAAKRFGFDNAYAIEYFDEKKSEKKNDIALVVASGLDELHRKIQAALRSYKAVAVLGGSDEINRAALENKKVAFLLSPEFTRQQDFMQQRNSGLNQVLCRLAALNKIAIGINFSDVAKLQGIKQAERIGRIAQNIRLCRKYKAKMLLASFATCAAELKAAYDLRAFACCAGMTPAEAKESLLLIEQLVQKKSLACPKSV